MELKIYNPSEDGFVKSIEWNNEEIKKELVEKVEYYKNLVYTDEQIKEAKVDRATLNKFIKALEDKRKEIKKQCLAPYEIFEQQIKELVMIVNEPATLIDKQVKDYEESKKQEKKQKIIEMWESLNDRPHDLQLEQIFDDKWLNNSTSLKSINDDIEAKIKKYNTDLETLSNLPVFGFEASEVYKSTLDINKSLYEAQRMSEMAKAKAEHDAKISEMAKVEKNDVFNGGYSGFVKIDIEQDTQDKREWISFKANLTVKDAIELKNFMNSRNIEFKSL